MSNTERKNGSRLLAAARQVAFSRGSLFRGMFTIGEVMQACEMSRPTVLKYLRLCEQHGLIGSTKFDRHMTIYRIIVEGEND
jgi:response regulator of citrate/malate metabolism